MPDLIDAARPADADCPAGTPLYVHLPFCVVKCTYCDFYSTAEFSGRSTSDQDLSFVLDDLLREAEARAPKSPVTVFLGGGTPSIHGPEELAQFLNRLDQITGFRRSAKEVTMECNPESLDLETAQAALEGGVNRLSIGIQSLDPATLESFGRAHGPQQAEDAVRAARAAGCSNLNVDIIYGASTQQVDPWRRELETILGWGSDHVSAYSLAYEEGTLMTKWRSQGRVKELDEDTALAFFESARADLGRAGLRPYEVSNFATDRLCVHNLNAWWNGPYVGLGPSAVSCVGGVRFGQVRSVRAWQATLDSDGERASMAWEEDLAPDRRRAESWWLGLRCTHGVDVDRLERAVANRWAPDRFLSDVEEEHRRHLDPQGTDRASSAASSSDEFEGPAIDLARELEREGWLIHEGSRWRLADHGWPLADAISRRFLDLPHSER